MSWRAPSPRVHVAAALAAALALALPASTGAVGRFLAEWTDPCDGTLGGAEPDHSIFTSVLKSHVVDEGELAGIRTSLVDYETLRRNPSDLRRYLAQLCAVDVEKLSAAQKLATLINAYNAWMLGIVVRYAPQDSVLELSSQVPEGSIWKHKFGTLGGVKVSLDDIEHGMIRAGLSVEYGAQGRIHAGVNCASLSCPDLLTEAFQASALSEQLTNATRRWLQNPTKNPGKQSDGSLKLSKIFDWYGADFVQDSGSIQAFVKKYNPAWSDVSASAGIAFEPYQWSLNKVNGTGIVSGASLAQQAGGLWALAFAAAILHGALRT